MPIFPSLNFKQTINITELFWGVTIVLAIIERSIELFITAWRNPRKVELEQDIAIYKEQIIQSLSEEERQKNEANKTQIDQIENEISNKEKSIETNKKTIKTKLEDRQEIRKIINNLADDEQNRLDKEEKELESAKIQAVIDTLQQEIEVWTRDIENLENNTLRELNDTSLGLLLANRILDRNSPTSKLDENRRKLQNHKKVTARYALGLGLLFGLLASVARIRILEPLFDLDSLRNARDLERQLQIFQKFDLMISALGIAGGTKLFHGLPSLISETLSSTSSQIKAAATKQTTN
ncbi:MAG: hypothetical protein AAF652_06535 [Cyanobacteria bacterium P01_C01_bin.72]